MNSTFQVVAFSPLDIPLRMRTGLDPHSRQYKALQHALAKLPNVQVSHSDLQQDALELEENIQRQYKRLDVDVQAMHLCTFEFSYDNQTVKYVVFPNQVAIAEVYLQFSQTDYVRSEHFEDKVNDKVAAVIRATRSQLIEQLKAFVASAQNQDISFVPVEKDKKQHLYWTSRCISLSSEQLTTREYKAIVKDWLKETEVPEHADELGKTRNESMTWLNYVVIDSEANDFRFSTMTLAQYCYIAHEKCNLALRAAIDSVYAGSKIGDARDCLQETRTQTKLHQIAVNEQTKYLTRPKRALLNAIFESWEYDRLIDNGEAMMEICDTKIAEADAKQRTINSQKSDRILFSISLFAVFELLVFLSQYSREVMSRPALDYTDEDKSWILAFIAGLDADFIFGLGLFAMLALGITYVYVAREKL